MTTTDTIAPDATAARTGPRDMPAWLAGLVVALCVAGGMWLLWWYFQTPPRTIAVPMTEGGQPRFVDGGGAGNTLARRVARAVAPVVDDNWTDDVRALGAGNWNVRAGDAGIWITKREANGAAVLNLRPYYRNPLVTGLDSRLSGMPNQVQRRPEALANLSLTPEQTQKLTAIRPLRGMKIEPAEEARLKELWTAYDAAPDAARAEPKEKFLTALKEIGAKNLEPTKQALAEQVAQVKAILTPEQLAKVPAGPG